PCARWPRPSALSCLPRATTGTGPDSTSRCCAWRNKMHGGESMGKQTVTADGQARELANGAPSVRGSLRPDLRGRHSLLRLSPSLRLLLASVGSALLLWL